MSAITVNTKKNRCRIGLFAVIVAVAFFSAVIGVAAEETEPPRKINVRDYGAVGDGVTDDTAAILRAIADLKDGDTLYIPAGNYFIREYGDRDIFLIKDKKDLSVVMDEGAVLQLDTVKDNRLPLGNRHHVLHFHRCENLTVTGGAIYGDRRSYTGSAHVEQGCGVRLSDCRNAILRGIEIAYFRGDAIKVFSRDEDENGMRQRCYNVTIDQCHVYECFRNGITLQAVDGCVISNTVVHDIYGTEPEAAVDIEAEYEGAYNHNVTIENCRFYNNGILSVAVTGPSKNIAIISTEMEQRVVQGPEGDGLRISDCTVDFVGVYGKNCVIENTELRYVALYNGNVSCTGCRFDGKGWIPYRVLVTEAEGVSSGFFKDCTFQGRGLCALGGCIVLCDTSPKALEFENCDFKSCGLIPFLGHLETTQRQGCFFDLGWALWLCILSAATLTVLLILRRRKRKLRVSKAHT